MWSACSWVYATASMLEKPPARSCRRSSGGVSIRMAAPASCTTAPLLVRLSLGSVERQTGQSQPIWGTPNDVPVPRKVSRIVLNCFDLQEVGSAWHVERYARGDDQPLPGLRQSPLENPEPGLREHRLVVGVVPDQYRSHAPDQGELAEGLGLRRTGEDRHRGAAGRHLARG